jgi:hypothetical protein
MFRILKYCFVLFLAASPLKLVAQELNCNVQVSAQMIQSSNREVFDNKQRDLYQFMNNTIWTNNVFSFSERIDCNILINLSEQLSADEFRGTIQIQLRRPVFNTTYNSTILNFIDNNFQFRYVEHQTLEFDLTTHRNNLLSILAYYTYIILGFDYDSFSPLGGTEFFQIADRIVTNAQNAPESGWKPFDGARNRNRYWLVKNILNREYENVRLFNYQYHIRGLDMMEARVGEGRTNIVESLRLLQEFYKRRPDPYLYFFQLVMDTKSDELVNVFSTAFPEERGRVLQILNEIDPANRSKYERMNATSMQ